MKGEIIDEFYLFFIRRYVSENITLQSLIPDYTDILISSWSCNQNLLIS